MTIQDSASQHSARHELSSAESRLLEQISLDQPWSLVERFSGMHRWRPEDVNTAAEEIAGRLRKLGVPVEVHQPEIFLSIPISAQVESGGKVWKGKAPSSCLPTPQGLSGELVYLPANQKALRSYTKNVAELFGQSAADMASVIERIRGRILITEGFGNPALTKIVEEWGGIGLIAINPGVDTHWGTCTTVWGIAGSGRFAAPAGDPRRRRLEAGRPRVEGAGCIGRFGHACAPRCWRAGLRSRSPS